MKLVKFTCAVCEDFRDTVYINPDRIQMITPGDINDTSRIIFTDSSSTTVQGNITSVTLQLNNEG